MMGADVVKRKEAKAVQGKTARINDKDGNVMVDGANAVKTDIETSNGVIHPIDAVILPYSVRQASATRQAKPQSGFVLFSLANCRPA